LANGYLNQPEQTSMSLLMILSACQKILAKKYTEQATLVELMPIMKSTIWVVLILLSHERLGGSEWVNLGRQSCQRCIQLAVG